jgi:FKBP-type peptidyl-prolyl cis-trans isomerase FkpA
MPFYALGMNVAMQVGGELKGILSKAELASMLHGFSDTMLDKVTITGGLLQQYGPKLNEILVARTSQGLDGEKKKGSDFAAAYLADHASKGALKTASGLIFHETSAGSGAKPNANSTVLVHYHGSLPDGAVFDSSVQRGEPIKFPLKGVIQGWQEGLALMTVGSKATLIVPSDLAYGDRGSPPVIPPGATLRFDVELIEIQK